MKAQKKKISNIYKSIDIVCTDRISSCSSFVSLKKFVLHLSFKCQHQGIWCVHQQKNMKKFRARSRSTRAISFHVVIFVALVWLCGSFTEKCAKPTKAAANVPAESIFCPKIQPINLNNRTTHKQRAQPQMPEVDACVYVLPRCFC